MYLTAWITLAALGLYLWTCVKAGSARTKHKVMAPSMDGPAEFQSFQRVHLNTLEQLPLGLVPMWTCAYFLGDAWGAAGGLLWCVGRLMYALGYYRDPAKREPGFSIALIASMLLMVGTAVGLLMR